MSEYTDIKNHTYRVEQTCLASEKEKAQIEAEIVEELYRIFTKQ